MHNGDTFRGAPSWRRIHSRLQPVLAARDR
nr:MAG TPA: hypothetical protein [Bacteriophage sp.]